MMIICFDFAVFASHPIELQGCPQQSFELFIVDHLVRFPFADLDAVHLKITNIVKALPSYGCFQSMLGIFSPLPCNDRWKSSDCTPREMHDRLRFEEIITSLAEEGLFFDRKVLINLASSLGNHT